MNFLAEVVLSLILLLFLRAKTTFGCFANEANLNNALLPLRFGLLLRSKNFVVDDDEKCFLAESSNNAWNFLLKVQFGKSNTIKLKMIASKAFKEFNRFFFLQNSLEKYKFHILFTSSFHSRKNTILSIYSNKKITIFMYHFFKSIV